LIREEALSMLSVELCSEEVCNDIFEMLNDMEIPVLSRIPTAAELAAMQSPRVGKAPSSIVTTHIVGSPIGSVIIVLRVGAEGGCITQVAQALTTGWRYRYTMVDQTALWLDEGDSEIRRQSPWVYQWSDALAALDCYPRG
jgi:hypothetical protein